MAITRSVDLDHLFEARHPVMTLLSGPVCVFSHYCRIILLEKDIERSIEYVAPGDDPARLGEVNPYGETPTLLDRDLALYDTAVIAEYLDERFPHPPLMPVDPINRAKARLMISRLSRDWLAPVNELEHSGKLRRPPAALKRNIRDGLTVLSPLLARQAFFMGAEYSLADATITPLLWRLPALGVELAKPGEPLLKYAERMFNRPSFTASLSPKEAALR